MRLMKLMIFHEIKSCNNDLIATFLMRSKGATNTFETFDHTIVQEIKSLKSIIMDF